MAESSTPEPPNEPVPAPQPPAVTDYPTSGPWTAPTTPGEVWGAPPSQSQPPVVDGARPRVATWKKVAGGVVLAAVIGGAGVAAVTAANASSGSATAAATPNGMTVDGYGRQGFPGGQGFQGGQDLGDGQMTPPTGGTAGGFGAIRALAGALHGEFVSTTDGGATQTMRMQNGTVSAAASGSLTVASTDGFTATYVVPASVDVSAIAVGDQVMVIATVDGETVTATAVQSADAAGSGMPGGMRQGGGSGSAPSAAPTTQAPQTS